MRTVAISNSRLNILPGMREVQARWSPQERRQRAAEGQRRIREFLRIVERDSAAEDVWAVGALGDEDLRRLVG